MLTKDLIYGICIGIVILLLNSYRLIKVIEVLNEQKTTKVQI